MSLPPSLEAFIDDYSLSYDRRYFTELVQLVAHEACRLQRKHDLLALQYGMSWQRLQTTPLVVPEPE